MNNLELMQKRLNWQGGNQENRMIRDKYKTFIKTLSYSYQGCDVSLTQKHTNCEEIAGAPIYRALINPDKTKQSYDDKILSIDYVYQYEPGDIFLWHGTDTHWIIYLQALTEDAYFRGEIRLCQYKIKFKDENGNVQETWAAIRGPVETAIDSIQKNQVRVNRPNESLNILMPLNDATKSIFKRYSEFLFNDTCWRVVSTDSISMKNVLEITAKEYVIDRDTDDVANQLKDGLVIKPVDPTPDTSIQGKTFIKPQIAETYSVEFGGGAWSVSDNAPVCLNVISDHEVEIEWNKMTSGQFTLYWSNGEQNYNKVIVVESLF